jgi:acyl carrier protein
MDSKIFIQNFADQFEDVKPETFTLETRFRDIEGWSSFVALSIIAMVDEVYNIKLTGEDIRKIDTLEDILGIIRSKM